MPKVRPNGTVQMSGYVDLGLYQVAEDAAEHDGVSLSVILRRALMQHFNVDPKGNPRAPR